MKLLTKQANAYSVPRLTLPIANYENNISYVQYKDIGVAFGQKYS